MYIKTATKITQNKQVFHIMYKFCVNTKTTHFKSISPSFFSYQSFSNQSQKNLRTMQIHDNRLDKKGKQKCI